MNKYVGKTLDEIMEDEDFDESNPDILYAIALAYKDGLGVDASEEQYQKFIEAASEAGSAEASELLNAKAAETEAVVEPKQKKEKIEDYSALDFNTLKKLGEKGDYLANLELAKQAQSLGSDYEVQKYKKSALNCIEKIEDDDERAAAYNEIFFSDIFEGPVRNESLFKAFELGNYEATLNVFDLLIDNAFGLSPARQTAMVESVYHSITSDKTGKYSEANDFEAKTNYCMFTYNSGRKMEALNGFKNLIPLDVSNYLLDTPYKIIAHIGALMASKNNPDWKNFVTKLDKIVAQQGRPAPLMPDFFYMINNVPINDKAPNVNNELYDGFILPNASINENVLEHIDEAVDMYKDDLQRVKQLLVDVDGIIKECSNGNLDLAAEMASKVELDKIPASIADNEGVRLVHLLHIKDYDYQRLTSNTTSDDIQYVCHILDEPDNSYRKDISKLFYSSLIDSFFGRANAGNDLFEEFVVPLDISPEVLERLNSDVKKISSELIRAAVEEYNNGVKNKSLRIIDTIPRSIIESFPPESTEYSGRFLRLLALGVGQNCIDNEAIEYALDNPDNKICDDYIDKTAMYLFNCRNVSDSQYLSYLNLITDDNSRKKIEAIVNDKIKISLQQIYTTLGTGHYDAAAELLSAVPASISSDESFDKSYKDIYLLTKLNKAVNTASVSLLNYNADFLYNSEFSEEMSELVRKTIDRYENTVIDLYYKNPELLNSAAANGNIAGNPYRNVVFHELTKYSADKENVLNTLTGLCPLRMFVSSTPPAALMVCHIASILQQRDSEAYKRVIKYDVEFAETSKKTSKLFSDFLEWYQNIKEEKKREFEETFDDANILYEAGNSDEAYKIFKEIAPAVITEDSSDKEKLAYIGKLLPIMIAGESVQNPENFIVEFAKKNRKGSKLCSDFNDKYNEIINGPNPSSFINLVSSIREIHKQPETKPITRIVESPVEQSNNTNEVIAETDEPTTEMITQPEKDLKQETEKSIDVPFEEKKKSDQIISLILNYVRNNAKKVVITLASIIAFFTILNLILNHKTPVNPYDYITVTFDGYNGYGTAEATIDDKQLFNDKNKDYAEGLFTVETKYNPEGLSNGDEVTVTVDIDSFNNRKAKLKLTESSKTYTVEGLKEFEVIGTEIYDNFDISFNGINGTGGFKATNHSEDNFIKEVKLEIIDGPQSGELSNGDEISIVPIVTDESSLKYGKKVEAEPLKVTVNGLGIPVTSADEIPDSLFDDIENEIVTYIKPRLLGSENYEYYNDLSGRGWVYGYATEIIDTRLEAAYLVVPKAGKMNGFHNKLIVFYKFHILTNNSGSHNWFTTGFEYINITTDNGSIVLPSFNVKPYQASWDMYNGTQSITRPDYSFDTIYNEIVLPYEIDNDVTELYRYVEPEEEEE